METPLNSAATDKRSIFIYSLVCGIVLLDQITKIIVKNYLSLDGTPVPIIGNFLRLNYIENSGMAFGIQMQNKILFTLLSVIATLIVSVYLVRLSKERFMFRFSLALILGGAIGNLIDRILRGRVVDFIDVEFFDISLPQFNVWFLHFPGYSLTRWPIFNIADSAVTCGLILLTLILIIQKNPVKQELTI
jgi:signal peptidase II